MIYVLETKFSVQKSIFSQLIQIYGINKATALIICKKIGFSPNLKVDTIPTKKIEELIFVIESLKIPLNTELRTLRINTVKNSIAIKTYKGLRKVKGLPVRGQRTHTNAKSSRKRFKNEKFIYCKKF